MNRTADFTIAAFGPARLAGPTRDRKCNFSKPFSSPALPGSASVVLRSRNSWLAATAFGALTECRVPA